MKNRIILTLFLSVLISVGITGCSDDDKLPVDFDDLNVTGQPFATEISSEGSTNINKLDPASSTFSKTYNLFSLDDGFDVTNLSVFVSFAGLTTTADEALLYSIDPSSFNTSGTNPEVTINYNGADILSALSLPQTALEGGDVFNYRLAFTNADGVFSDVSANFDNQSADHTFGSTVVCIAPPPAGTWSVDMADSYGDGWQPLTGDGGGAGIIITLNTGEVIELGLCTPYEDPGYPCVDQSSSGTQTFEIPEGTESADFYFAGDFWGEMSFQIYAPSGNLVASGGAGAAAGPIAINLCNE
ncbi:hypothetical protein A9Q86_12655 [Flavobacteriales bacterium 33_180_T64]|nr:hypothetical protein A9Q86_12655 [Flavobacteriales bacterium 33_180_T64]